MEWLAAQPPSYYTDRWSTRSTSYSTGDPLVYKYYTVTSNSTGSADTTVTGELHYPGTTVTGDRATCPNTTARQVAAPARSAASPGRGGTRLEEVFASPLFIDFFLDYDFVSVVVVVVVMVVASEGRCGRCYGTGSRVGGTHAGGAYTRRSGPHQEGTPVERLGIHACSACSTYWVLLRVTVSVRRSRLTRAGARWIFFFFFYYDYDL